MRSMSLTYDGGQPWHAQFLPESFSAGRVALRRHHRQNSVPLGTRPALDGGPSDHDLD